MAFSSVHFFLLFLIAVTFRIVGGKVTKHITSKVALPDTNATFVCAGFGLAELRIVTSKKHYNIQWSDLPSDYETRIFVNGYKQMIDGKNIRTFVINILAENETNGTELSCEFADSVIDTTGPVKLYVAKDELGSVEGFQQPQVAYTNTSITISWSPPWSHPVNNYTLTMTNKSDSVQKVHDIDIEKRSWTMYSNSTETECHELECYVTAFTDVGSKKSKMFSTGFPINLGTLNNADVLLEVLQKESGDLKTEVHFEAPRHCSFVQRVLYNYSFLENKHPSNVKMYGPLSNPGLDFEGFIKKNGSYRLQLAYWEHDFQLNKVVVTKYFYTNFSEGSHNVLNVTSCATETDASPSNLSTTMAVLIAGIGGLMIIVIVLCVFLVILLILRTHKRVRQTVSTVEHISERRDNDISLLSSSVSVIKPMRRERKRSVPQVMATNPIYEGTSTLYSYLPDPRDLKNLSEEPLDTNDLLLVIPPQLPPPRKTNLDSPGVKSGVQLSLDKQAHFGKEEAENNDQYIPMQSASELRYVKSPVLKMKMEEASGDRKQKTTTENDMLDNREHSKDINTNHALI